MSVDQERIAEMIERAARIAAEVKVGDAPPLSTSETLAAAFVLNRPDLLTEKQWSRAWTLAEAIARLGPDWTACVPIVEQKLRSEGLLSQKF